ncbi:MAG TPA: MFS transporter [Streptosporangiaceae bacterium]
MSTQHQTRETAARRPGYATVALLASGATFLAILDATIANLAVAGMRKTFHDASVADLSWVISLYAITFAAILAPAGRLADVMGRRTLYAIGIGLFSLMSLICAIAPVLPVLLAARALQGVGAAAMIPASLAVILVDSPPERRLAAIGVWSASASAAAAVGPSLGGLLIDAFTWRAVFIINVPIGIALLVGLMRVVQGSAGRRGPLPDVLGTAALALGIGGLVLGVTKGTDWHWTGTRTLTSLAVGAALVALALWRSARQQVPAIETKLWRNRTFALANVVSLLFGAALYAWLLVGVLFLVNVWHYSELAAGFALSPGAVFSAVAAIGIGRALGRWNPRVAVLAGCVLITAMAAWLVVWLPADAHFVQLWLPTATISGFGFGAVSTGVSSAAALSVQPVQFAGATGLNMAARQVGGALGIAVLAAILAGGDPARPHVYSHVLLFCALTAAGAGIVGLGLSLRPKAAPAGQQPAKRTASATSTDRAQTANPT